MLDLPRFEHDAEAFCRAAAAERFVTGAGLQAVPGWVALFDDFGHLFRDDTYGELLEADLPPRQKQLCQDFVASGFFAERTAALAERLAARETAATVPWDDQAVPLRWVPVLLANEPDARRRHALAAAYYRAVDDLNSLYQERHRVLVENAGKLGADYVTLFATIRGLDLADVARAAQRYLELSARPYFDALDDLLSVIDLGREHAWLCDLGWLLRGRWFDRAFGARALLPTLYRAARELGLDLEVQSAIRIDLEPRPLKGPRPFCVALDVPDDVRLVLQPHGGRLDYTALFHLAGQGESYANRDRSQPFAYRWLVDDALQESYGLLWASLLCEPAWLSRYLDLEAPTDAVRVARLERLYGARRAAVAVLWESMLHRGDDYDRLATRYAELFTRELGVEHAPALFLADTADGLAGVQQFRAWIFEAQLRRYLQREYDAEWYRLPRAGRFLRDLWREGSKYPLEELARYLGYSGLDLRPLADELLAGVV